MNKEIDKIIQISQDAEGNLLGLGESGVVYKTEYFQEEGVWKWAKNKDNPSKEESEKKL